MSRDYQVVWATMMGNECFMITIYIYIYIYIIYIYIYVYTFTYIYIIYIIYKYIYIYIYIYIYNIYPAYVSKHKSDCEEIEKNASTKGLSHTS